MVLAAMEDADLGKTAFYLSGQKVNFVHHPLHQILLVMMYNILYGKPNVAIFNIAIFIQFNPYSFNLIFIFIQFNPGSFNLIAIVILFNPYSFNSIFRSIQFNFCIHSIG